MKTTYFKVVAGAFLYFTGIYIVFSQSGPEFINCPSSPISLCVNDPGVRLPANNQFYSSEADTNATSCSVHVTQSVKVKSSCGHQLQYGVQLFLNDTSSAYTLRPLTAINTDSLNEAELVFNTELSPVSFIHENGIPYNTGCMPNHRIKWIVIDSCGNINECEQLINLYDCQAPNLSDSQGHPFIISFPAGCWIHLFAKDFVLQILDDCTPENTFLSSLKEERYLPDSAYYSPCDVPAFGVELPFDIWVADEGLDLDCSGSIQWSERNVYKQTVHVVYTDSGGDCCEPFDDFVIQGRITTEDIQTVELVYVNLESPGHVFPTYITTENGEYNFNHIVIPADVNITAKRDDNHRNGVSTLDLVKIQKHLLGIERFSSPYQLIAADANNSRGVSAIDMVELRRLILGKYDVLPNNQSWRFVPKNYVFQDSLNPWPFDETITTPVIQDVSDADFIGIKIGDVNHTASPNFDKLQPRDATTNILLFTEEQNFKEGEMIDVPIYLSSDQKLTGFQFTLDLHENEFFVFLPGRIEISDEDYAVFGNKITLSWFDVNGIDITDQDVLFTIQLKAKQAGLISQSLTINSDITAAELYLEDDQTLLPILSIQNPEINDDIEILSVGPNPWKDKTTISFTLAMEGNVSISLIDINGREIYKSDDWFQKGHNQVELTSTDFKTRGLLVCQIRADNQIVSARMIVLD